jgi:membrane protein DedA with SNARE-associated domain
MGEFSSWHLLSLIIWVALFLVPAWKIAKKAGFPGALSLLMFIPLVNIALLWVFAFVRWPNLREPE